MDQIGQEKYLESVEDQFLDVEKKKYMFKALENLRKKNKKNYEIYVAIKILDIPHYSYTCPVLISHPRDVLYQPLIFASISSFTSSVKVPGVHVTPA